VIMAAVAKLENATPVMVLMEAEDVVVVILIVLLARLLVQVNVMIVISISSSTQVISVLLVQPIAKNVIMRPLARLTNVTLDMGLMEAEGVVVVILIVQLA